MKRIFCFFIVITVLCLTACGSSRRDEAKENMVDNGLTEAEADEILSELTDEDIAYLMGDSKSDNSEVVSEQNDAKATEEYKIKIFEVSEEIQNSKLTDDIVQIGAAVIPNDASLTLKDFISKMDTDSGYDSLLYTEYYTDKKEIDNGSIIVNNTREYPTPNDCGRYVFVFHGQDLLCKVFVVNFTDDIIPIMDAKVWGIEPPVSSELSFEALNYWLPGNINYGLYAIMGSVLDYESVVNTPEYQERLSETKYIDYQELQNIVDSIGVDGKKIKVDDFVNSLSKNISVLSENLIYNDKWARVYVYSFYVDETRGIVGNIEVKLSGQNITNVAGMRPYK